LATRNARFLLALAPGAALTAWQLPGLATRLVVAAAFAVALDAACLRLRGLPVAATLVEGGALRAGLLLVLWLPQLPIAPMLGVLAAALVLRQLLGGLGGAPFHAAMLAAAFAQLLFAAAPTVPGEAGSWLALAWLGGGLALVAARQVRWQGPLALLLAAALCALPAGGGVDPPAAAPWLLAAFYLLPEAGSDGESATVRLLVGAIAGVLAVLAAPAGGPGLLPFALLAASALAPALSRRLAPRPARQA
jgi:electron transport complex protein RnfD